MEEQIKKTIGLRLAALRLARGVVPADVAQRLGITLNLLGRIERGGSELTASQLVCAAQLFGVSTSVLVGEEKYTDFMERIAAMAGGK